MGGINLNVLKVLSGINNSTMLFRPVDLITTTKSGDIVFRYKGESIFENEFAVDDLSEFISALKYFDTYDLEFKGNNLIFKSKKDKSKFTYNLASKSIYESLSALMGDPETLLNDLKERAKSKKSERFIFSLKADFVNRIKEISKEFGLIDLKISYLSKSNIINLELLNCDRGDGKSFKEEIEANEKSNCGDFEFYMSVSSILDDADITFYQIANTGQLYFATDDGFYDGLVMHLTLMTEDKMESGIDKDEDDEEIKLNQPKKKKRKENTKELEDEFDE